MSSAPTRSYWAPPKTPDERFQILRDAFVNMSQDPEFQKHSKKLLGYVENMEYKGKKEQITEYLNSPEKIVEILKAK